MDPFQPTPPPVFIRKAKRAGEPDVYHFFQVPDATGTRSQGLEVASAGLVPFIPTADPNRVHAMLQVEDMEVWRKGKKAWVPSLAMLGGKAHPSDEHWTRTALREMHEELGGGVLQHVQPFFAKLAATCPSELPAQHGATTTYVPNALYQAMFLPAPESEAAGLLQLPGSYYQEFQGMTSNDLRPGDWSRAAYMLVWVELQHSGQGRGWRVTNTDLMRRPGAGAPAYSSSHKSAAQFAQPWSMPVKEELKGALKTWGGP